MSVVGGLFCGALQGVDLPGGDRLVSGLDPVRGNDALPHAPRDAGHGVEAEQQLPLAELEGGKTDLRALFTVRELRRRETGDRRRASAEPADMPELAADDLDGPPAIGAAFDRLPEGRLDIAELRLEAVPDLAEVLDPGIGRRVLLRVSDHRRRRVLVGIAGDQVLQHGVGDFHILVPGVAPGSGAADVDPSVQCAHERDYGEAGGGCSGEHVPLNRKP